MEKNIEVLVVEDSHVVRMLLVHILDSDPRIRVIGSAGSGEEAIGFLHKTKPDVIVIDIHMPGLDGYETTRSIMETQPVPIIICTASSNAGDVANTFRALDAGAVALIAKPVGPAHPDFTEVAAKLVETVIVMSEVRVVKRWPRTRRSRELHSPLPVSGPSPTASVRVVAIGASTGGPPVLQTILSGLPANFPAPVLIVQHIAAGFLPGLVEWLVQTTGFPAQIAAHGETMLPGRAYLAPDGYHMGLNTHGQIALSKHAPENGLRPAVAHLFRSTAAACGPNAVAVLLTGMGKDGAEELKQLRDLGALTLAQDAESSIVHGMPGEAIKLGGAVYVLAPHRMAAALTTWAAGH